MSIQGIDARDWIGYLDPPTQTTEKRELPKQANSAVTFAEYKHLPLPTNEGRRNPLETVQRGPGGAPKRTSILPTEADKRKQFPVGSGVLEYFPDALVAIAEVSWHGNQQHNPGQPLNWARSKSTDEYDTMIRHSLQRGTRDVDGLRHTAKMAWRALAILQKEIEAELEAEYGRK